MGCNSSTPASNPGKASGKSNKGDKPIVTLTGVTGYLGAEVCLRYLKDGGFRVRGTVRDKNNQAKLAPLKEAFGPLYDQLELVEADLMNE